MLLLLLFTLNTALCQGIISEEQYFIHSIRTVTLHHLNSNNMVLSCSSATDRRLQSDVENILIKEFHSTELWSVLVSSPSDEYNILMNDEKQNTHDNYIIIIYGETEEELVDETLNQLQRLSYENSWNPRARFLIATFMFGMDYNPKQVVKHLLQEILWWKIVDCTVLIKNTDEGITQEEVKAFDFYTWFPYQDPEKCLKVEKVELLDRWIMTGEGHFKYNADLFPRKIGHDLSKCPIIATTFPIDLVVGPYNESESELSETAYNSGLEIYLIKLVTDSLNLNLKFRPPPPNDERWGTLQQDGSLTGLLSDLVYEKSDIAFGAWPLHPKLVKVIDSTVSYFRDDWVWWVPCAKKIPRWKAITMIFHLEAWFGLIFSIVISVIFVVFLAKYSQNESDEYREVSVCVYNIFAIILGVSVANLPCSSPLRTFFVFWFCYGISVNTIFQAYLTTFLIDPGVEHQINGIEEVLDAKIKYGYNPGFDIVMQDSSDTLAQTILNNRVECFERNIPPCLDWIAYHHNFSLLCSKALLQYILSRHYVDDNGNPHICQAEGVFFPTNYVTYMTKWNPLLSQFNVRIARLVESGIRDNMMENILHRQRIAASTIRRKVVTEEYFPLSLEHSQGIFAILVPGLSLSILTFFGELLCPKLLWKCKQRYVNPSARAENIYSKFGYLD